MELQNFNVIDNVLEGLNLGQYKEVLKENSIDHSLLKILHQSGTLVANLIEIIPSFGHRLQILGALNNQFVDPQFEIILDPETLPATNSASENNSPPYNPAFNLTDFTTPSTSLPVEKRSRKRKLIQDTDPHILDIKSILKKSDIDSHTTYGHQIINATDSRQPISYSLRKKLVSVSCTSLMNKINSARPSTDHRRQLAECVIDQLFHFMPEAESNNLKIQNDFNHLYPLAADNLFSKWDNISEKMMQYGQLIKRTVEGLNISSTEAESKPMIAAFFLLSFLIRPKNRRASLLDSVDSFIKVRKEHEYQDFM
ncbi:hypothetical protein Fcan01_18013 [Folsomia candida]|uniref:Uncharacterized protein n=1 Tax=Folsomia candida TaxID=158441 RepID=A0A226DRV0_FOLCA|nr:hypothetical protein Fcan01_18013 [Folsomia candida]